MSKIKGYVANNFDAINAHTDAVIDNEKQLLRLRRFRSDRVFIRNAGLLMLAIAMFAILLATAYYIYKKYATEIPGPVKVVEVIKEVPGPVKVVEIIKEVIVPGPERIVEIPGVTRTKIRTVIRKVPIQSGKDVKKFTLWYEKEIEKYRVITGADYMSVDSPYPTFQYCYVVPKISDGNISKDMALAQKSGKKEIEWNNITDKELEPFGVDLNFIKEAKKHCNWRIEKTIIRKREPITPYPSSPIPNGILGSGSGFYVNNKGYILTNNHVVNRCSKVWIKHDNKEIVASVLKTNKQHDLAIIQTNESNKSFVKFAELIDPVEDVMALGFPQVDILGEEIKRSKGNISSLTGMQGNDYSLQHTAIIQKGNSGGPLLNNKGSLVGVNYAKFRAKDLQGVGLAIHASTAMSFLGENSIDFELDGAKNKLDWSSVYKQGKKFTVRILCAK